METRPHPGVGVTSREGQSDEMPRCARYLVFFEAPRFTMPATKYLCRPRIWNAPLQKLTRKLHCGHADTL